MNPFEITRQPNSVYNPELFSAGDTAVRIQQEKLRRRAEQEAARDRMRQTIFRATTRGMNAPPEVRPKALPTGAEPISSLRRSFLEEEEGRYTPAQTAVPINNPFGEGGNPVLQRMLPITLQSESGGRRYGTDGQLLTSSAGARGEMQVLDGTNRDPGFGIRPAANNSPDERARVGRDYLEAMLRRYGGDPAKAWAAYNAGPGRLDDAIAAGGENWLAGMPAETKAYVQKNMQAFGGNGIAQQGVPGFQNPFDPTFYGAAMDQLNSAHQAALRPTSFSTEFADAPTIPDLPDRPVRDFSAEDAQLETLRPQIMSEKERGAISRQHWLAGVGQALANTADGAGLGKVLAMVGAGALMGRASGMQEIQARLDMFDEKMAQFNTLKFQHEGKKADQAYNEAAAEVAATHQQNMLQWQTDMDEFKRNNNFAVQGNNVIVQKQVGNQVQTQIVPIASAIDSAFAMHKAGLLGQIGAVQNRGNAMQVGMTNQYIAANARMAGQTGQMDPTESMFQSGAVLAAEAVASGLYQSVLGTESAEVLQELASDQVLQEGYTPGTKEYAERMQRVLATKLFDNAMADERLMQALVNSSGALQNMYQSRRALEAQRTTRITPKGSTFTVKE